MLEMTPFALAVLALLAAPGPTNAVMAAAGAQRGLWRGLSLLWGALAGYLIALWAWMELVGALAAGQTWVPVAAKVIGAAFLLWSAARLWSRAGATGPAARGISLGRVFFTTLLNPKALVFAFAIFPSIGLPARLPYLGIFAVLVIATGVAWTALGSIAARSLGGLLTSSRVERTTAVALAVFATLLVVQTVQGML